MGRVCGNLAVSRSLGDFVYKDRSDLPPSAQKVSAEADIHHIERHVSHFRKGIGSDAFIFSYEVYILCREMRKVRESSFVVFEGFLFLFLFFLFSILLRFFL